MEMNPPVKSELLLFIGVGLLVGSAVIGLVVGLIYLLQSGRQEFRYGVFYSVFALVASLGFCLASIAFFFRYLNGDVAIFCALVASAFFVAISLAGIFLNKDSLVLFTILSFYSVVVVWLAPVSVWNMIYLALILSRPRLQKADPPPLTSNLG